MRDDMRRLSNMWSPSFSLIAIMLVILMTSTPTYAQEDDNGRTKNYYVIEIDEDGTLSYREYEMASTKFVKLENIEVWDDKINSFSPLRLVFWDTPPDFETVLLRNGYASIIDPNLASSDQLAAQEQAQSDNLGLWFVEPTPTPPPTAAPALDVVPTPPPAESEPSPDNSSADEGGFLQRLPFANRIDLNAINTAGQFVLAVLGLYGGAEFIQLVRGWFRRHRVRLIMVGRPSTGKTWFWKRLVDRDITENELFEVDQRTLLNNRKVLSEIPMGRFEIVPEYIDVAGGNAAEQLKNLLSYPKFTRMLRNFFFRGQDIWLLFLSTTEARDASYGMTMDELVDKSYIDQQLGHLELPMGSLQFRYAVSPKMIFLVISKFDLYSQHPPTDAAARAMRNTVEQIFTEHLAKVQTECINQEVPFKLVFVSALKNWGTEDILRHISNELYR